ACRLTGSGGYATCTCVPKIGDPYSLTVGRHLGMATVGRHLGMPSAVPRFGSQRVQKGLPGGSRSRHVLRIRCGQNTPTPALLRSPIVANTLLRGQTLRGQIPPNQKTSSRPRPEVAQPEA